MARQQKRQTSSKKVPDKRSGQLDEQPDCDVVTGPSPKIGSLPCADYRELQRRLAANLKRLRESLPEIERSQERVAAACGLGRATYQRFELCGAMPTLDTMAKLAAFFKVPLDELVKP